MSAPGRPEGDEGMSAAELERRIANILDDMRTEWIEGLLPKLTTFVIEREQAAYRRALEDAAKDIDLSEFYDPDPQGQVSQECGHAETVAHRWLTARADAAPDPRETKD